GTDDCHVPLRAWRRQQRSQPPSPLRHSQHRRVDCGRIWNVGQDSDPVRTGTESCPTCDAIAIGKKMLLAPARSLVAWTRLESLLPYVRSLSQVAGHSQGGATA